MKRFPEMTFPIERGPARYAQLKHLFRVAEKMKTVGTRVDMARIEQHIADASARAVRFRNLFLQLTGLDSEALGEAGAGQTKAVKDYFWETLKAPPVVFHRRTKKAQFNTPTLVIYATDFKEEPLRSSAAALYGLRAARTALRFLTAYRAVAQRHNGRIHFGFNPLGTKGVRWSASASWRWFEQESKDWVEYSLNAQNIPTREPTFDFKDGQGKVKLAVNLRDIFIADDGCLFWGADYEQLEPRLAGYTTGAANLIKWATMEGGDLHWEHAKRLFKEARIPDWVTAETPPDQWKTKQGWPASMMRKGAKPLPMAFIYAMPNDKGETFTKEVYKQLVAVFGDGIQPAYVDELCRRFFEELHPEIRKWQNSLKKQIKDTNKTVLSSTGDFLYLPNSMRGYNMAANFPMQSGGGVLINQAVCNIDDDSRLIWEPNGTCILMQVHDELLGQCREEDRAWVKDLIENEMSAPAQIGEHYVGIPTECKFATNAKDCK